MQKNITQTLITINEKALKSLEIEGNLLYMIQNRHQKPYLVVRNGKLSSKVRRRDRQAVLSPLLLGPVLSVPAGATRPERP